MLSAMLAFEAAIRTDPGPISALLLTGFAVGVFGYLSGYRIFVAIGIAIVFAAGLLAPQF